MSAVQVDETRDFKKAIKTHSIDQGVVEAIYKWAPNFTFVHSSRSDMVFRSPRGKVEIWEIRVPDGSRQKGASGGYRMLCFRVVEENTLFLDYMWPKSDLNKQKVKQEYTEYLKTLKGYVSSNYDPR